MNILELLKKIAPILPAPIYWEDTNSVLLGGNEAVFQATGANVAEAYVGKDLFELYPADMANYIKQHNEEVMKTRKILSQEEIIEDISTGEIKYFTAIKGPLMDEKGNVIGIIGTSIDITERKKMEKALLHSQKAAEAANDAKSEFIRNMEHQLRTPFSGVYSLVEMMASQEVDPEKKEMLQLTYQSAKEFLDLLDNIIDFSRNQLDSNQVLEKKFDLKDTLARAITMEQAAAVVKKLTLTFSYPEKLPTIFLGDPYRITRLALNLLGNAIKFTHKGSVSLEVELLKKVDKKNLLLKIMVKDTGIGIPDEKQRYVYEKFYRLHPANQNTYKGAGLGLYVVKQIINELNGEIDVLSSPETGTCFICTLPFKRPLADTLYS